MTVQPFLIGSGWQITRDGDPSGRAIFERHYSAASALARRRRRQTKLYVGPGFKLVLLWPDARALFIWRKERERADGQVGVNCAVFRNEGAGVASELILAAEAEAWNRWPAERLFTFVDPRRVRGNPPSNCFYRAGWRRCGTSAGGLHILEKVPA